MLTLVLIFLAMMVYGSFGFALSIDVSLDVGFRNRFEPVSKRADNAYSLALVNKADELINIFNLCCTVYYKLCSGIFFIKLFTLYTFRGLDVRENQN